MGRRPPFKEAARRSGKAAGRDRLTKFSHEVLVIVQVMDRVQARTEDFVRLLQMVEVGTAEIAAGIAAAGGIEWGGIVAVTCVPDLYVTVTAEQPAVPRVSGRHYTVKHIHAGNHGLNDVFRRTHPHEVSGFVAWKPRGGMAQYPAAVFLRFTHRQAADCESFEFNLL